MTLPSLFLMTVIFMSVSSGLGEKRNRLTIYFLESYEQSRIQGHAATVLTLPSLFLMTVIFMLGNLLRCA